MPPCKKLDQTIQYTPTCVCTCVVSVNHQQGVSQCVNHACPWVELFQEGWWGKRFSNLKYRMTNLESVRFNIFVVITMIISKTSAESLVRFQANNTRVYDQSPFKPFEVGGTKVRLVGQNGKLVGQLPLKLYRTLRPCACL